MKLSQASIKGMCYNEFLLPHIFRRCAININGGGKRKMMMQMRKGSLLTDSTSICSSVCTRLHLLIDKDTKRMQIRRSLDCVSA